MAEQSIDALRTAFDEWRLTVGHQWTNIVLYINGQTIPLPPIAYLTRNECQRRGIEYKTEHEHI